MEQVGRGYVRHKFELQTIRTRDERPAVLPFRFYSVTFPSVPSDTVIQYASKSTHLHTNWLTVQTDELDGPELDILRETSNPSPFLLSIPF